MQINKKEDSNRACTSLSLLFYLFIRRSRTNEETKFPSLVACRSGTFHAMPKASPSQNTAKPQARKRSFRVWWHVSLAKPKASSHHPLYTNSPELNSTRTAASNSLSVLAFLSSLIFFSSFGKNTRI